jgi:hypothetical protein
VPWGWAIEVKMLRLMGDNGKLNDNMVMHILSPYPAHLIFPRFPGRVGCVDHAAVSDGS